ncbi:MFS transporter [Citrobacter telavivensis]
MNNNTLAVRESFPVQGTSWSLSTWALLFLVSGALFLDGIDLSMVNIALPSISSELALSTGQLQWIVNAYILGYGGFLLLGGRVADLLGRRTVFLTAVGIFGLASIVSASMNDASALIALRFIKGIAAGFTVPAGMSIVATSFAEGPARARALTLYSVIGTLGFALGLVLGGVFTELGWRVTLFVPGPLALVIFLAGLRLVPQTSREKVTVAQFDILGALSMTGALLLLVYALVEAPVNGWTSHISVMMFTISVVLIIVFIWTERRHTHPLVRLGIFRSVSLVHANVSAALLLGSFMAFQFVATLYLQESLGWAPLEVALAFLPSSLPVTLLGPRMGALFAKKGTDLPVLIGLSFVSVAYLFLLRAEPGMPYWSFLLPTMLLVGFGFAFGFPAVNVQGTMGVKEAEQGLASGLLNTSLQIGGAVSLAIIAAVLSSADTPMVQGELLPNMKPAIATFAGIAILGMVLSLLRLIFKRRN